MAWPKLVQYLLQKAFIIGPLAALDCRLDLWNRDGVTVRAHWRGEILNWMSHIGKQAVWEEANRRVSLREGWQYQQGWAKMVNKTVSSWFRALTFLPISEQDEIFSLYSQFQLLWVSQDASQLLWFKRSEKALNVARKSAVLTREKSRLLFRLSSSHQLWFACSPGTLPEPGCGEGKKAIPMATVPQIHHSDLLLLHSLLCNYSWFTSTGESSRVMLIPSIIISQTGSRPEQGWRTTEVLWDMIMKQTGLGATSASCYRQVLSAWLQGQVYMDLAGPLTPLHLHLRLSLEVRAVRELGRLHTEVNTTAHYLPEKPWIVIPPSGLPLLTHMATCGGTQGRLGQAGHCSKSCPGGQHQGRCWPEAPPGCQDERPI